MDEFSDGKAIFGNIFICGDRSCDCDTKGKGVLLIGSFEQVEDTPKNREKYKDEITGGSVSCSKCGRSAFTKAFEILEERL